MALPSEKRFIGKFIAAIVRDMEIAEAYFERFGVFYKSRAPEQIVGQIIDKLSNYGGYRIRRSLVKSVQIRQDDCVLDIGPEMGMECFLLAEVYNRVLVAEPDVYTADLLKEVAKYYITENGRRASEVIVIQRAGIILPDSDLTLLTSNPDEKPSNLVQFDARGAADISNIFGVHFADRVVCNHIVELMPAKPRLFVLLSALSSYCTQRGTITWCEDLSSLVLDLEEDAKYRSRIIRGKRRNVCYYYKSMPGFLEYPLKGIKSYIAELLTDFSVTFRLVGKHGQCLIVAKHREVPSFGL